MDAMGSVKIFHYSEKSPSNPIPVRTLSSLRLICNLVLMLSYRVGSYHPKWTLMQHFLHMIVFKQVQIIVSSQVNIWVQMPIGSIREKYKLYL